MVRAPIQGAQGQATPPLGIQNSKSVRNPTNLKLDTNQEKAFCWYLTSLWEIGVPLRQKTLAAAAN
jgi:hypothetical protein